uniref:Uncharacterized protein n=1 Tax=Setaria digitata TaxID=48799 RepID=A0A915PJD3_9BILA
MMINLNIISASSLSLPTSSSSWSSFFTPSSLLSQSVKYREVKNLCGKEHIELDYNQPEYVITFPADNQIKLTDNSDYGNSERNYLKSNDEIEQQLPHPLKFYHSNDIFIY